MFTVGAALGLWSAPTSAAEIDKEKRDNRLMIGFVSGFIMDNLAVITGIVVGVLALKGIITTISPAAAWGIVGGTGVLGVTTVGIHSLFLRGKMIDNPPPQQNHPHQHHSQHHHSQPKTQENTVFGEEDVAEYSEQ